MSNRFFSEEDLRGARRWEPGALGKGYKPRSAETPGSASNVTDARSRAREEGYRAGFAAGEAAARAATARLEQIALSAQKGLLQDQGLVADSVLDLALDLARQIVRADIKIKRDDVLPVVREAMACLPQSTTNPQLLMHPSDVDLVRAHIGDELQLGGWRMIEDHRIEPGGCRISAANCEIDATLSTRWKRVLAALGRDQSWIDSDV
jgi:flagellar assembly protein FliH